MLLLESFPAYFSSPPVWLGAAALSASVPPPRRSLPCRGCCVLPVRARLRRSRGGDCCCRCQKSILAKVSGGKIGSFFFWLGFWWL
uniref:Uncharacterized protein n=1 Tax=Oryza meridionalis TaxID=40149 RepID=A0A0E0DIA7_9ORYZ